MVRWRGTSILLVWLFSFNFVSAFDNFANLKTVRSQKVCRLHASTSFSLEKVQGELISVKDRKSKLEAVLKRTWGDYGLQSLFIIEASMARQADMPALASDVTQLVDNLCRRNGAATAKLFGSADTYMLSLPSDSPSSSMNSNKGRSRIIDVYSFENGMTYKAKVVKDKARFARELSGYCAINGPLPPQTHTKKNKKKNGSGGAFAAIVDSLPDVGTLPILVLERGVCNLRDLRDGPAGGPLGGKELRVVMRAMCNSVRQVHDKGLVWGDCKLENFVLVPRGGDVIFPTTTALNMDTAMLLKTCQVKAIDCESVCLKGEVMTDFAAETVAPELASQLTGGTLGTVGTRDRDWRINPQSEVLASQACDVFALGLSWLELCGAASSSQVAGSRSSSSSSSSNSVLLGSTVSTSFARIAQYAEGNTDLGLSRVVDPKVKKLLERMMAVEPRQRPTMREVALRLLVL